MFVRRFSLFERQELLEKSRACLWTKAGVPGLNYMLNIRRLSESVIKKFEVGYVPISVDHQLAGRLIFPIYDASKNLIALSSRYIHLETTAYLPSYWHESYEKSFYLYAMHISKDTIRKWKFAILCEGQIDTMQLHNHGMGNTIGLCGKKLSDVQLSVISRYCNEIVLLLDRDPDHNPAGQIAAAEIMEKLTKRPSHLKNFKQQIKVANVELTEQSDPDEFVIKHGIDDLKKLIKHKIQELRNAN